MNRQEACKEIDRAFAEWYVTLSDGRCASCEGMFVVQEVSADEVSETLRAPVKGQEPAGYVAYTNEHTADCELIARIRNAESLQQEFGIQARAALMPIAQPDGSIRTYEVPVRVQEPGDPSTLTQVVRIR